MRELEIDIALSHSPSDPPLRPCSLAHVDDFDSDPEYRARLPSFYGYLPDDGMTRLIMYGCMVVNSALLLLLRSIGAALIILVDAKIFLAYIAGDQLLYLLYKLARRDFLHWMPLEGVPGLVFSLLMRCGAKTITDFTGVLQLRASGEMGGFAWLWAMVMALVVPWVAVPVYFETLRGGSGGWERDTDADEMYRELKEFDVYSLLAGLTAGWVCAFAVFLSLMKKSYRSTFWSVETGNEWIQSYFLQGGRDDVKIAVMWFNRAKWKAIEPQVKDWVASEWLGWEREKPAWFTDSWKALVPVEWVPKEGADGHRKARASERRRTSFVGALTGAKIYAAAEEGGGGGDEEERS
jgi:hypothetical protein